MPHRGGNGAVIGNVLAKSISLFSGAPSNDLIESLKKSSKYLAQTSADFAHQLEEYEFLSVIETRGRFAIPIRTVSWSCLSCDRVSNKRQVVVDSSASTLGLAGHREQILELDRDHRQICQLERGSDLNRVLRHMKRISKTALTQASERDRQAVASADTTGPGNRNEAKLRILYADWKQKL